MTYIHNNVAHASAVAIASNITIFKVQLVIVPENRLRLCLCVRINILSLRAHCVLTAYAIIKRWDI